MSFWMCGRFLIGQNMFAGARLDVVRVSELGIQI